MAQIIKKSKTKTRKKSKASAARGNSSVSESRSNLPPNLFTKLSIPGLKIKGEKELEQETSTTDKPRPLSVNITYEPPEIAELWERVKSLEEGRKQKSEEQLIPVQFLESEKLDLKHPIFVSLLYYPENQVYVIDLPELNIYGQGRDEESAIKDFKTSLEETYFSLKKDKSKLGLDLGGKWKTLNKLIKEKK